MDSKSAIEFLEGRNYTNVEFIGEGCYGSVYSVKDNDSGQEYAANVYNITKLKSIIPKTETDITQFILQQIDSLKQFNNTNELITYHKHFISDDIIILILDLYRGTTLSQYIDGYQGQNIPEKEIVDILKQVVGGTYNIHNNNTSHHNLKPDNIFILEDKHTIKIGHFGPMNNNDINSNVSLNKIRYLSPEIINNEKCDNKCCDVWSIGIIALDLCFGNYKIYPLILWSNEGINKVKKEYNRDIYSLKLLDFIIQCLNIDYHYRINIKSLLNHPLFGGIDNINYDDLMINDNDNNNNNINEEIISKKPKLKNASKPIEQEPEEEVDMFGNNTVNGDFLSSLAPGSQSNDIGDIDASLLTSDGLNSKKGGLFKNKLMGAIESYKASDGINNGYSEANLDLKPEEGGLNFISSSTTVEQSIKTTKTTYTSEINNNGDITYNTETTTTSAVYNNASNDDNNNNDLLLDDFMAPRITQTESINPNLMDDNNNNNDLMDSGLMDNNNNNDLMGFGSSNNDNQVNADLMGSLVPNAPSNMDIGNIDGDLFSGSNDLSTDGGSFFKQKLVNTIQSHNELEDNMSGYSNVNLDLQPNDGGLNFIQQPQNIEIYTKDYTYGHVFNAPDEINTEWPGYSLEQSGEYYKLTLNCPKATITLYNPDSDKKSGDISIEGGGKYYYVNDQISASDPSATLDLLF